MSTATRPLIDGPLKQTPVYDVYFVILKLSTVFVSGFNVVGVRLFCCPFFVIFKLNYIEFATSHVI